MIRGASLTPAHPVVLSAACPLPPAELSRDIAVETDKGGLLPCPDTDCSSPPRLACEGGSRWSCALVDGPGGFCPCPAHLLGDACSEPVAVFGDRGFIRYSNPKPIATSEFRASLSLRTTVGRGVVFSVNADRDYGPDFVILSLQGGSLELAFSLGFGTTVVRSQVPINNDQWFDIDVSIENRVGSLRVEGPDGASTTVEATAALGLRQLDVAAGGHIFVANPFVGRVTTLDISGAQVLRAAFTGAEGVLMSNVAWEPKEPAAYTTTTEAVGTTGEDFSNVGRTLIGEFNGITSEISIASSNGFHSGTGCVLGNRVSILPDFHLSGLRSPE